MSSDTPLTDAKVFLTRGPGFNSVDPNFARTLERRVTELGAQLAEMREALARIYWLRKSQLRDADEGLQLCREIAARALSENEEKK
jgi:hypothetical protein